MSFIRKHEELLEKVDGKDGHYCRNKVSDIRDVLLSSNIDGVLELTKVANNMGMDLAQYLDATISPITENGVTLYGFDQTLESMGMPVRKTRSVPHAMKLTTGVFQKYPAARSIFGPTLEAVVRWGERVDRIEQVDPLVAARTSLPTGNALISQVMDPEGGAEKFKPRGIAEGAELPIHSMQKGERTVQFYKFGMAIQTTYEFLQDVSLETLAPYWERVMRYKEMGQVAHITSMLINGDGVHAAATEVNQSTLVQAGTTPTNGEIHKEALLRFLVNAAKNGTPFDTLVGNYDTYYQLLMLFANSENSGSSAESLQKAGVSLNLATAGLTLSSLNFAVSSTVPANKIIGMNRAETIELLEVAGSDLTEESRNVKNQTIWVGQSQRAGARLLFGDTREILNYGA